MLGKMETVELGDARLHAVPVYPGVPGEADRAVKEVARVDPAVILADMDTDECLRLIESLGRGGAALELAFVDDLFAQEARRRFAQGERDGEHPLHAVARLARRTRASFIPLRPVTKAPGWLARRRARAAVASIPPDLQAPAFARAFAQALAQRKVWRADADAVASEPRARRALAEGRAPVVALLQGHRADAVVNALRLRGRAVA